MVMLTRVDPLPWGKPHNAWLSISFFIFVHFILIFINFLFINFFPFFFSFINFLIDFHRLDQLMHDQNANCHKLSYRKWVTFCGQAIFILHCGDLVVVESNLYTPK